MSRIRNDTTGLPAHMRAVFYRQYARDAECMAHKCPSLETSESYRRLAQLWLALAEQMDEASGIPGAAPSPIEPLHLSVWR
jgi:hypothetical protein